MLEEIRISGLGVIDDAVLELGPGFTVITGETGAGKTMVVAGLGLLFGARADAGRVAGGRPAAAVEGRVVLAPDGPVATRAAEAGAQLDDGALVLARSVSAEGRSRAHAGGRTVPAALLAELGARLVAVHGQAEQHLLLTPAAQRAALDRYAGEAVSGVYADYQAAYRRWRNDRAQLAELETNARAAEAETAQLRAALADIDAVAPAAGEDRALAGELARLAHADALRSAAGQAHDCLLADPDALSPADVTGLLGAARRTLDGPAAYDPALAAIADRLAELSFLLADVAADLASYLADVDVDPARLSAAQERQALLTRLIRQHAQPGAGVDEVLAWAATARARLTALAGGQDRRGILAAQLDHDRRQVEVLAGELSARRQAAAVDFATAVRVTLARLAMPQATVTVQLSPLGGGPEPPRYGPDGADAVELLMSPHPGQAPRPLGKGASGGELSRIMLAVEVAFAGADPVPTMVFDEVDAGVGGKAAVEVGRLLAQLSRDHQVLAVTHLPQVAAFADRHLVVVKDEGGAVSRSGVRTLDRPGRIAELSRMLAGLAESAAAQAHAEELLISAAGMKAIPTGRGVG